MLLPSKGIHAHFSTFSSPSSFLSCEDDSRIPWIFTSPWIDTILRTWKLRGGADTTFQNRIPSSSDLHYNDKMQEEVRWMMTQANSHSSNLHFHPSSSSLSNHGSDYNHPNTGTESIPTATWTIPTEDEKDTKGPHTHTRTDTTPTLSTSSTTTTTTTRKKTTIPILDYESMAFALRWTCELNRQLLYTQNMAKRPFIRRMSRHHTKKDSVRFPSHWHFNVIQDTPFSTSSSLPSSSFPHPLTNNMVHRIPFPSKSTTHATVSTSRTIFHAKKPMVLSSTLSSLSSSSQQKEPKGLERWGPNLYTFLQTLAQAWEINTWTPSTTFHLDSHRHSHSPQSHTAFEQEYQNYEEQYTPSHSQPIQEQQQPQQQQQQQAQQHLTIFALAFLYLDRACSVETHREPIPISMMYIPQQQQPHSFYPLQEDPHHFYSTTFSLLPSPCPYLLPQTVHHLLLTAVLLACRIVRLQPLPPPPPPSLWSWWDCTHLSFPTAVTPNPKSHNNIHPDNKDEEEEEENIQLLENSIVDEITKEYASKLQQHGIQIDALTLYRMQIAMIGALGTRKEIDDEDSLNHGHPSTSMNRGVGGGLYVENSQVDTFLQRWKNMFGGM